jgi:glutaminyl-peptide cyclotransferase
VTTSPATPARGSRVLALTAATAGVALAWALWPAAPASTDATQAAAEPDPYTLGFSPERAWAHLEALVAMGPRAHGTPGQAKCRDYIREHLRACGVEPRDIAHTRPGVEGEFVNIAARFSKGRDRWVLIGTHYDSRLWADEDPDRSKHQTPIVGANDSGSGTAVLLELCTALARNRPMLGVEVVFFDGEEWGRPGSGDYMEGSKNLARTWDTHYPGRKPEWAVVLDMVGEKEPRFVREQQAQQKHPWLNDLLWTQAKRLGYGWAFAEGTQRPILDDHAPLLGLGIPATVLIDLDYAPWHTLEDTLDKCSPKSLQIAGDVVLAALAATEEKRPPGEAPVFGPTFGPSSDGR